MTMYVCVFDRLKPQGKDILQTSGSIGTNMTSKRDIEEKIPKK